MVAVLEGRLECKVMQSDLKSVGVRVVAHRMMCMLKVDVSVVAETVENAAEKNTQLPILIGKSY